MFNEEALIQELNFKAIRSSGSGGQHVNKVASKIELTFNLKESLVLHENQKELLIDKLKSRLTKDHILILQCDESRSQHKNKDIVTKRFLKLIHTGLIITKRRIPTKIPKAIIRKRLKKKRLHADKKANRKKPNID